MMSTATYEKKTIAIAKAELEKIPRLIRLAHARLSDIHSVVPNGMPHAKDTRSHVEDRLIKQVDAQRELGEIKFALELCTDEAQALLTSRYLNSGGVTDGSGAG
ncbi:hypothetical protein [Furfurilactobacillus entadae]|uniref:hypothetical protein n=1 Tax=Furfurilactobacillus entadae TaxID=2922307 RepID=UPI0035E8C552